MNQNSIGYHDSVDTLKYFLPTETTLQGNALGVSLWRYVF
jgi:hypothetical protein